MWPMMNNVADNAFLYGKFYLKWCLKLLYYFQSHFNIFSNPEGDTPLRSPPKMT